MNTRDTVAYRQGARALKTGIGIAAWLVGSVIFVMIYSGTLYSASADVSHHALLTTWLMDQWAIPANDSILAFLGAYPRLAHLLASAAGKLTGSALQGMQVIALLSLFTLWTSIVASFEPLPRRQFLVATLGLAFVLGLNKLWFGLEVFGHEIIVDYYFAHLVSQSLAIAVLAVCLRLEWNRRNPQSSLCVLGLSVPVLASTHLMPSLMVFCTLVILTMLAFVEKKSSSHKKNLLIGIAMVVVSAALTAANPDVKAIYGASATEGKILLRRISDLGDLLIVAGLTSALSAGLLGVWWRRQARPSYGGVLAKYLGAFGLSSAGLCFAQTLLFSMFDVSSRYACMKYAIALQSLLIVNSVTLFALCWRNTSDTSPTRRTPLVAATLLASFICVLTFSGMAAISTAAWITAAKEIRFYAVEHPSNTAGKEDLAIGIRGVPPVGHYFITKASLRSINESLAIAVLLDRAPQINDGINRLFTSSGSEPWDVPACRQGAVGDLKILDGACVFASFETLPCKGSIDFTAVGALDAMTTGFTPPGGSGRWSEGPTATFACNLPAIRPKIAHLNTIGLVSEAHAQRMTVSVNGGTEQLIEYSFASPSRVVSIELPDDQAGLLRFHFSFPDATSPLELGINMDNRKLGVMIKSIRFE